MDRLEAGLVSEVETRIGYRFLEQEQLVIALTHRSYAAEHMVSEPYERLEFLGDAVLQLAVTRYLFERYPEAPEGEMAKVRAAVVSAPVLASLAERFGLGRVVRLGKGEERTGGREKESILSDVMESVLGVIYRESGYEEAEAVVWAHWGSLIDERATTPGARDYKTRLQEELVRRDLMPEYQIAEHGPEHAKEFTAVVIAGGERLGAGEGTSKKRAEQQAAQEALERLRLPEDA